MPTYYLKHQNVVHMLRSRETLVGRSEHCAIVLAHSKVSRMHSVFRLDDDGVELVDLGSMNGTRVNGQRLRGPRRLEHGDLVQIGAEVFEFSAESGSAEPESTLTSPPTTEKGQPSSTPESTLELVESLLNGPDVADRGEATLRTARALLDNTLRRMADDGKKIDEPTAERIFAVVDRLIAHLPNEANAGWRAMIAERLKSLR